MSATVIKDFLVSLGFSVDKKSELAFNDSLKKTAENAAKLGLAIEAAAAAVTGSVVKIAQGMEQSYYQSKRLGGSVKDINAVGYAISQVGGSAEGAKQSMEGIADFMRRLPGGRSFIQKMVGTEADASNVPAVMGALAKRWSNMDYAHAKVEADFIHVDDNTLQAMIRDGGKYYEEYQKLVKKAGVNEDKLAGDSQALMVKVRGLGASFSVLGEKIQQALMGKAGAYVDKFKNWVEENFDEITKVAVKVSTAILHAAETIVRFIKSAIKWYDDLDPKGKSWAKTIAAIAGSVWLLNKAFGSSPIGIILQLATAIATLYADYENWKKTGQVGLVDWSKWKPTIENVIGALKTISHWFGVLVGNSSGGIGGVQGAMEGFAAYMAMKWMPSLLSTFGAVEGGVTGLSGALVGLRGGLIGVAAVLAANSAYNVYDTYEKVTGPRDKEFEEWDNARSKSWYYGNGRRIANWLYDKAGAEKPYTDDLLTKQPAAAKGDRVERGSRMNGGAIGRALTEGQKAEMATAIRSSSERLGMAPEDMATIFSFETGGTMNPWQKGPRTKWGQHRGLIQWGEPQRKKYGVSESSTITEQVHAVERYLKDAGFKPGMGLLDAYSAVNAGRVGRYNASDASAGGTWGTVADKVKYQMGGHRNALASLEADKKRKEQQAFITEKLSLIPDGGFPMNNGPFDPSGAQSTVPLLPDNISNNSNATMNLNVENKFMGSVSEKQVQSGVEKGGRVLLRNMQPAIR